MGTADQDQDTPDDAEQADEQAPTTHETGSGTADEGGDSDPGASSSEQ